MFVFTSPTGCPVFLRGQLRHRFTAYLPQRFELPLVLFAAFLRHGLQGVFHLGCSLVNLGLDLRTREIELAGRLSNGGLSLSFAQNQNRLSTLRPALDLFVCLDTHVQSP
jgi:hypothetical protein